MENILLLYRVNSFFAVFPFIFCSWSYSLFLFLDQGHFQRFQYFISYAYKKKLFSLVILLSFRYYFLKFLKFIFFYVWLITACLLSFPFFILFTFAENVHLIYKTLDQGLRIFFILIVNLLMGIHSEESIFSLFS